MRSHKALIIGLLTVLVIGTGAFFLYWFELRSPIINLIISPAGATIKIDGKTVPTLPEKSTVGQHTITISEQGYVTYTRTIKLVRTEQYNLTVLLKPTPSPMTVGGVSAVSELTFINGNLVMLGNNGTALYSVNTSGDQSAFNASLLTSNTLSGVEKVVWRPDGKVALIKKSDGVYLYDFSRTNLLNQTMTLWGTGIGDITWSPDSFQAVYSYYNNNGEQSLIASDVQNDNTKIIANLAQAHINHPILSWSPDGQYISMIDQSPQKDTNYLYNISVFDDQITQLTQTGNVTGAIWSPNSQWLAYTTHSQTNGQNTLWLVNNQNQTIKPLNVDVSSIKDVCWSPDSKSLIIAEQTNQGYSLVNVGLNNNVLNYQYSDSTGFAPSEAAVSPDGKYLFYAQNNRLESLSLITNNY